MLQWGLQELADFVGLQQQLARRLRASELGGLFAGQFHPQKTGYALMTNTHGYRHTNNEKLIKCRQALTGWQVRAGCLHLEVTTLNWAWGLVCEQTEHSIIGLLCGGGVGRSLLFQGFNCKLPTKSL